MKYCYGDLPFFFKKGLAFATDLFYSIRDPDFEAETILIVFRVHSFIQMFYDSLVLNTEGILQEVEYFKN